jgi:hypothetical protein
MTDTTPTRPRRDSGRPAGIKRIGGISMYYAAGSADPDDATGDTPFVSTHRYHRQSAALGRSWQPY